MEDQVKQNCEKDIKKKAEGYYVINGKIVCFNPYGGYREYETLEEICLSMNINEKEIKELAEQEKYWRGQCSKCNKELVKEILKKMIVLAKRNTPYLVDIFEIAKEYGVEVKND